MVPIPLCFRRSQLHTFATSNHAPEPEQNIEKGITLCEPTEITAHA